MSDSEEHVVKIRWGSRATQKEIYDGQSDADTYRFDSEEEQEAFLRGVSEAIGWSERRRIESDS